jgi:hypothetical protein
MVDNDNDGEQRSHELEQALIARDIEVNLIRLMRTP